MQIDLAAIHRHYLEHLLPVWRALPPANRGDVYLPPDLVGQVPGSIRRDALGPSDRPVLVAGNDDMRSAPGRRFVLMEHGCGQSYAGDPDNLAAAAHPAYAGGDGRGNVLLFLCPNEYAAARNRDRYPQALTEIIGSPRLAALQAVPFTPTGDAPVLAVSFHWDVRFINEAMSAWTNYSAGLAKVAEGRFHVIGHGHPRWMSALVPAFVEAGIEPVADFNEVLRRAHVYACDNSSTLFEFAAVRGPVVLLDAPWYRRDIEHGLRFWDCSDIGPRIGDPALLESSAEAALAKKPWPGAADILDRVFPPIAEPAQAAADAIVGLLGNPPEVPPTSVTAFPRTAPVPR